MKFKFLLIAGFLFAGCSEAPDDSADIVFMNAAAYTLDADMPWAEAVAIKDKLIVYVGDNEGVADLIGDNTRQFNLSAQMLLPGFIDAHMHPVVSGGYARALSLNTSGTVEEWVKAIDDYAEANPDAPVIFGYGFLASTFGPIGPTRQLIDAVVPDRPVLIKDEGLHGAWANTKALEILNITQDTPDPVPGFSYYKRDENGDATGYLLETPTTRPAENGLNVFDHETVADGVAYVFEVMNAYGVTSAFDAGAINFEHLIKPVLKTLEETGRMTVRLVGSYRPRGPEDIDDAMRRAEEYRKTINGDYYHYRTFKIMDDGTVEGRTAAMFEDYQGEPGNSGATVFTEEEMTGMVVDAAEGQFDVHIHALGERAVHEALNAIEVARKKHPDSATRYAICHIQVITDQDLPRFAELDVIAQSTPLWASYDEYGRQFVSEDQFNRYWRFNSLKKLGVKLTWGSDFPASGAGMLGLSPIIQMEIGHTRQYPGEPDAPVQPLESERLDIDTLIRGYTIDAAYQMHMEDEIGSLEVGKKADLVVLDRNLFETDSYEIHETEVAMTLMDGDIVYQKDRL
jgi:predicted amidohydrolase YtcJ